MLVHHKCFFPPYKLFNYVKQHTLLFKISTNHFQAKSFTQFYSSPFENFG